MTTLVQRITLWMTTFGLLATLGLLALQTGMVGSRDPSPPPTPTSVDASTPVGVAVLALTGPHPMTALASLGTDPAVVLGYRPVIVDGSPAAGHGGCSSPVPLPRRFEPACKVHDLGYDLLRAAAREGHPLGGWARRRLDHQLVEQLHRRCHDPICSIAADLVDAGVSTNTWRQRSGVPVGGEDVGDIVGSVAVAGARR